MSAPGIPGIPDDPQTPLFGQPVNSSMSKLQQALVQRLLSGGDEPAREMFGAIHKAVSPLLGYLLQRRLGEQQSAEQDAALPELSAAMHSDDPIAAIMSSKSPLVRQMASGVFSDWLKNYQTSHAKADEMRLTGPIQTEQDVAKQKLLEPVEVQKATDIDNATFPHKVLLQKLGQSPTYAGQAETARHNKAMEGLAGQGAFAGGSGPGPWDRKW